MGTEKRQRQKEGRQARLAAEQTDQRRRQQRRRLVSAVVISLVVFAVLVLISQAGTDDEADTAAQATNTTLTEPEPDAGSTTTTPAAPAAFEYGSGECPPAEKPAEPVRSFSAAPQRCIEDGVDYAARFTTSEGTFTVDLLEDEAPGTVNNFVVLARYGYYEGAPFHRVIADFVVQGGDPVGDPPGTGGPGYTIPDELPAAGSYQVGSVAMANSFNGQVGRNSGGSQFFVVTGEQGVALPPNYSLFGTVVEGAEVVELLEATAEEGTQTPTDPATIESVEIVEQ
jgi:cyclophilin family peptidyl-prolyl cis-trans isomerase/type II secretory pathway pseudopilin PulG